MRSTCSASLGCLTMSTVDTTSLSLIQIASHLSVKIVNPQSDHHRQVYLVKVACHDYVTLQCLDWPDH